MKPALELSLLAKGSSVFGLKWPGDGWPAPSWARLCLDELAKRIVFFNRIAPARRFLSCARLGRRLPPVICAALAVGAAFASPVKVNDEAGELRKWFAIPSQSLTAAIQAYSQQSGVQVLYESNLAAGQTSANVEGNLSAKDALRTLLSRTSLVVHYTHENAITLTLQSKDDLPPMDVLTNADLSLETLQVRGSAESAGDDVLNEYASILQSNIQAALQKNEKTRSGRYQFGVKLWIDSSRIVQRIQLFESTGDRERDASVAEVLRGLVISRAPPPDTLQPVHVLVTVRSLLMSHN